MKRLLNSAVLLALVLGHAAYGQGMGMGARRPPSPEDVFISADTDSFDPGLAVGEQFPSIRALYQGQEISDIDAFIRDKGAVFIAQRSVDW